MGRIKEHYRENRILYRMFGHYTLLSIIVMLVMSTTLFHIGRISLEEATFRSQKQLFEQTTKAVDFCADYVSYLMETIRLDDKISSLFNYREKDDLTGLSDFSEFRMRIRNLSSIYIYNENENVIYSTSSKRQYQISTPEGFEDSNFIDVLENISEYEKFTPILRKAQINKVNGEKTYEYVYTYLMYDKYKSGAVKNIMAFNFSINWLKDVINDPYHEGALRIVDKDDTIIYSDLTEEIGSKADEELQVWKEGEAASSGYIVKKREDGRHLIVYAKPARTGYSEWTFVSEMDIGHILEPIRRYSLVATAVGGMFMFVILISTALLSGKVYVPVRETLDEVRDLQEEKSEREKREQKYFLRRLFMGGLPENPSGLLKELEKRDIHTTMDTDSLVFVINIDNREAFLRRYRKQLSEKILWVEQELRQSIEGFFPEYLLAEIHDEGLWAVAVPVSDDKNRSTMPRLFDSINDTLSSMGITVTMAVSNVGHALTDVPYLYSEAMERLSFRFLLGQNCLITGERTKELGTDAFEYPASTEKKIISDLFAGRRDECIDSYELFRHEISLFPIYDMRLAYLLLAGAIKRNSANTITEVSEVLMEMEKFHERIESAETREEVDHIFRHLFDEIGEKTKEYALQKQNGFIVQVEEYVEGHYGSNTLSMDEVADMMDLSAAYFGRLFKKIKGETFTEYLTAFRLEKACDALKTRSKTVTDISDEVGFSNSNYFYIVFKKHMGCTPNQYRKKELSGYEDSDT